MRYPKILCILSIFAFVGIGTIGINHVEAGSFEAFKSTDDPTYHQRHNGNIEWHLFQDSSESNHDCDKSWRQRIEDAEDTSRLSHLTPATNAESKEHSPCPLCGQPTYFWITGGIDSATAGFIKSDYPGWSKTDGACRNCFECYELRTGNYFGGSHAAATTDEYVIGYMKSPAIRDYFRNVK